MSWRLGHYLEQLCCPYCHARLEYRSPYLLCYFHARRFTVTDNGVDFRLEFSEPFDKFQKPQKNDITS